MNKVIERGRRAAWKTAFEGRQGGREEEARIKTKRRKRRLREEKRRREDNGGMERSKGETV